MVPHILNGLSFVERFYSLPNIDSTNVFAKGLKAMPVKGIFVIQADHINSEPLQKTSSGKARGDLWVSFVIRGNSDNTPFLYNRAISLAIQSEISRLICEKPVLIKWPNNISCGDKIICKIEVETIQQNVNVFVISFGLIVNRHQDEIPINLQNKVTSLYSENGKHHSSGIILRSITSAFYSILLADQESVHHRYSENLYQKGCTVKINSISGVFDSIEQNGNLRLLTTDGCTIVQYGSPVQYQEKV